ncbi:hypothetical protein H6G89_22935 [Oscillatoria sp. FACHB-1407]|uniref:hypothetical protein n=1 Tax=Oscillatoria sp. FACHB-1407 TaxID=2692847 RepID=UPI00168976CA|nr:hypothetical protein [Oscillatoria sp. FACHB-1407]MBD2463861.1 hypothetical protein [Oscillatoria sp. FACHB-1407]
MLKIEPKSVAYHGWVITIVMSNDEFSFECYPPTFPDFCNDGLAYSTLDDVLLAAYQFVDREIAILALMGIVKEWVENGNISEEEYWQLTSFD